MYLEKLQKILILSLLDEIIEILVELPLNLSWLNVHLLKFYAEIDIPGEIRIQTLPT